MMFLYTEEFPSFLCFLYPRYLVPKENQLCRNTFTDYFYKIEKSMNGKQIGSLWTNILFLF